MAASTAQKNSSCSCDVFDSGDYMQQCHRPQAQILPTESPLVQFAISLTERQNREHLTGRNGRTCAHTQFTLKEEATA